MQKARKTVPGESTVVADPAGGKPRRKVKQSGTGPAAAPGVWHKPQKKKPEKAQKYYRKKKRKGLWSRIFDEAVDAIEDIFD